MLLVFNNIFYIIINYIFYNYISDNIKCLEILYRSFFHF